MAVFKCKMCGGSLDFKEGESVATCEWCKTKQTLPKLDSSEKVNLYDRANHFRRNNEYDKAAGIYEQILNQDKTDAETYWSLVLCKYGIEYVEDPRSHKRVSTINRVQFTSIFMDENYKAAIQYADEKQRAIYEEEAKTIDRIQKGILEISKKEEPFDVFICYKETSNSGERTLESVLANELYNELTRDGLKTFFARITLENKLGTAYEPYIFAALNSAKVMVVVGTSAENLNSVWVKNEWSRFLGMIKEGQKKFLIPAYKNMDPYDLPEEFSHLQAQDLAKIGATQDLIHGIKKLVGDGAKPVIQRNDAPVTSGNQDALVKRMFLFLDARDWKSADEYCEKVLDQNPENAYAYVGKLMIDLKIREKSQLGERTKQFRDNYNYKKAIEFADENLRKELYQYSEQVDQKRKEFHYENAVSAIDLAKTYQDLESAAERLEKIAPYKNAAQLAQECREKAAELKQQYDKKKAKKKKGVLIAAIIGVILAIFLVIYYFFIFPNMRYNDATKLVEEGKYYESFLLFEKLDDYKDSKTQMENLKLSILQNAEVGDTVVLGKYSSDENYMEDDSIMAENGIRWKVLEKQDNKMLVICDLRIWTESYNDIDERTTWATCSLREWLNEALIDECFSDEEKARILSTNISNPAYVTTNGDVYDQGKNTVDKLYLLSVDELNKYKQLQSDDDMDGWWTRTVVWNDSDMNTRCNAFTVSNGYEDYEPVHSGNIVRPAMWISYR